MQFPTTRTTEFATDVVQFVDGAEQRFRDYGRPYRRWMVTLTGLDETEVQKIRNFVASMQGATGRFAFTDPWDGTIYPACTVESSTLLDLLAGPSSGTIKFIIRENRT
jgi:phage-related protein